MGACLLSINTRYILYKTEVFYPLVAGSNYQTHVATGNCRRLFADIIARKRKRKNLIWPLLLIRLISGWLKFYDGWKFLIHIELLYVNSCLVKLFSSRIWPKGEHSNHMTSFWSCDHNKHSVGAEPCVDLTCVSATRWSTRYRMLSFMANQFVYL